jgi:integrase
VESEERETRARDDHIKNLPTGQIEILMTDQSRGTLHGHLHVRPPADVRIPHFIPELYPQLRHSREGWLFANPRTGKPYHQEGIQKKHLKKAAIAAGIGSEIGWHTFRHTYRSWLDASGAPLKVQQELMRHASITTTMNVYGKAMPSIKRKANSRVVSMVLKKHRRKLFVAAS